MVTEKKPSFQPDESQSAVLQAQTGIHVVLAPPGCGKTQLLAERIVYALEQGIPDSEMLCLTFTNRAARGMGERIAQRLGEEQLSRLFVGNVHRYCSRFLFQNALIAADSSIIDDHDSISIISRYLNEDEYLVLSDYRRRREYSTVVFFAAFMHQLTHGHPKALRLHPDCVTSEDVFAMRRICEIQQMAFTPEAMTDMYARSDYYLEVSRSDAYDYGLQKLVANLMRKMSLARHYQEYKQAHQLYDFEDLLLLTYDALHADTDSQYKRYEWIQVDEVQDLNPMQVAIIEMLSTNTPTSTMLYFGDDQQAIFSFMGAKLETVSRLAAKAGDHVYRLTFNHRSPRYLTDVFNRYADDVLHIDKALLLGFDEER